MAQTNDRPVVVISNRGPVTFRDIGGRSLPIRGGGGLVSGLGPAVSGTDIEWFAAAMSDEDRSVAASSPGGAIDAAGFRLRFVDVPDERWQAAYDVVCNQTLWFVHHGLFSTTPVPAFDDVWRDAWSAYVEMNEAFSRAVIEHAPRDAVVLVHDYHLTLMAPAVRAQRRDLALLHFSHTPFATPQEFSILPHDVRRAVLSGLAAYGVCGFHTKAWAEAFVACCNADSIDAPATLAWPMAPDVGALETAACSPEAVAASRALDDVFGDSRLIVRVDRIELTKNQVRGFEAFDRLLDRHREWIGHVVFAAFCYPSRELVPAYQTYRAEVEGAAAAINDRWATDSWQPVVLATTDDYPRSIAALQRYDVLLVNPVRDGLNLVAMEGPILNRRNGALVLSPEAGAWSIMGDAAHRAPALDVDATAEALHAALCEPDETRKVRAQRLRIAATSQTPTAWLAGLLDAATA